MDCQAVALRVLAHFVPGPKGLDFVAPEADWLDIRWCGDDDSTESQTVFHRELPQAEVIWHILSRATRLRLVQKLGAGVNTIDVEPVPSDNPLLSLDNVVLTPHVTWYTADTMRRYLVDAVTNCRRLRDGKPLADVVNQPTGY